MFTKKENRKPDLDVFVMFDSKVGTYDRPFFALNQDDLLRDVLNNMRKDAKDPNCQNKYYMNAEDFSIFKIGSYYRESGEITGESAKHVVNLHELKVLAQPSGIGPT